MEFDEVARADELWGCPVDVLDRLWELRQRAGKGSISLEEWREGDAALRKGFPPVDRDEVRKFQTSWLVDGPLDMDHDTRMLVGQRLAALIRPAPSDEDLWRELDEVLEDMSDPEFKRRELQQKLRARRDRIAAWLTRPGTGLDPMSGLRWSEIAQYRVIDDPDLGPVPQYVEAARRLALRDATEADRRRAGAIAADRSAEFAKLEAEFNNQRLTGLPALLAAAARDDESLNALLIDQLRIWSDPRVQRLLMAETAHGWPKPFDLTLPNQI